MLTKQAQEKYFSRHLGKARKCLVDYAASEDPEKLHELRVAVKKIRALVFLQEGDDHLRGKLGKLRKIFRRAGEIRSATLSLERKDLGEDIRKKQEKVQKKARKQFLAGCDSYKKELAKLKKKLPIHFSDVKERGLLKLYKDKLAQLSGTFAQTVVTDEEVHAERKTIKQLLYLLTALPAAIQKKLRLNKLYLQRLEKLIGHWHDRLDLLDLLKDRPKPAQILEERDSLRKEITKFVADFYHKARLKPQSAG